MPLVFVHGIANRRERGAHQADRLRDAMFRRHLLAALPGGAQAHRIHVAHWGDLGGNLRWGGDSIPQGPNESLGAGEDIVGLLGPAAGESGRRSSRTVLDQALRWLPDAVDLLFTLVPEPDDDAAADGLAVLSVLLTRYYGPDFTERDQQEAAAWLNLLDDDEGLVETLAARLPTITDTGASVPAPRREEAPPAEQEFEILGGRRRALPTPWATLRDAARRLGRATRKQTVRGPVHFVRDRATQSGPLVIGDITEYLQRRGTRDEPGPIVQRVVGALERAHAERSPELPLYVLAHSLGGVIVHDVLTYFRPDLPVDVLVTVNSQPGLFEELKLFRASDLSVTGGSGARAAGPTVGRWINVVDVNDPLAFNAEPVFDAVQDYSYASGAWWAHTAPLRQATFYARLAHRIQAAGIQGTGNAR